MLAASNTFHNIEFTADLDTPWQVIGGVTTNSLGVATFGHINHSDILPNQRHSFYRLQY